MDYPHNVDNIIEGKKSIGIHYNSNNNNINNNKEPNALKGFLNYNLSCSFDLFMSIFILFRFIFSREQNNKQYSIKDLKEVPYNEYKDVSKIGGVAG